MTQNDILTFAKENGYDGAVYLKEWNGYQCYEPTINDGISYMGLPLIILTKGNTIRLSTPEEAMII